MSVVVRHDWDRNELQALFDLPFPELLHRAASVHRAHFDPAQVQQLRKRQIEQRLQLVAIPVMAYDNRH
ncbi:hypothetical protein XarbCFBP8150_21690, partial [Xanthomonas arboricola]